jgi:hypothetical protein
MAVMMRVDYRLYREPVFIWTGLAFVAGINRYLYAHPVALSLMAFIAFAYLYAFLGPVVGPDWVSRPVFRS